MKYIRKSVSVVLMLSLLFMFSFTGVNAGTIHETKSTETVTSGVTLETLTRFTDEGWQKINVLRVNLDNPNVKVDTLINSESIKTLTNVKTLAQTGGAVAAVNASFFSWLKESGKGNPDGPVIQSGEFLSADSEYNRYNDSMATLSIDNLNNVFYNYWKTRIDIFAPDGSMAKVTQYNKPSPSQYNDITIWSRKWDQYSLGVSAEHPDIVEMVVEDRIVKEIRQALPKVEIPQNGYVVIARGSNAQFLLQSFKVGDAVNFSISTTPDWSNIQMAVTGSAILVKDGQVPAKFSYNINGRHPRTAAGSSKSGKELILVAVDGRQSGSLGMTQQELAQLMLSLGAYNAVNLDGGGSTTMVSRKPGTNDLKVVNNPSDGSLRSIATAIGIFSIFPPSSFEGMIIDTAESNVFVNTSIELSVSGHDKYFNPVQIDQSKIKWSVSGIKGSFKGNVFYPETPGIGTVTASINNITSSIKIRSLDTPSQLILSDKTLYLANGKSQTLSVMGRDKNGYSAKINPSDITWALQGNIGKLEKNTFTATRNGTGYIDASLGNTHAYCAVSVASEALRMIDKFETLNGSFLSSPGNLPGSYEVTSEDKLAGDHSGKLTYDFTHLEGTRAAYVVFSDDGIDLSNNTTKISMWVNNSHYNTNWLRAEVIDASGKKHLIDFTKELDWIGWKRVEASLQSVKSPSKLTRVYLVQINPVPDSGTIFIDELSLKQATFPPIEEDKIPKDTVAADLANRETDFNKDSGSFRFSVFSGKSTPENLLQKLLLSRFSDRLKADDTITSTQIISDSTSNIHYDFGNSRIIRLNTSKNSIRTSSAGQWQWFLEKLKSYKGDNIFIIMKNSPDSLSDPLEGNLFKKVLVDYKQEVGKNIWVFYSGSADRCFMENEIRYVSTAGLDMKSLTPDSAQEVKYIEVTVNGKDVTYMFKTVLQTSN